MTPAFSQVRHDKVQHDPRADRNSREDKDHTKRKYFIFYQLQMECVICVIRLNNTMHNNITVASFGMEKKSPVTIRLPCTGLPSEYKVKTSLSYIREPICLHYFNKVKQSSTPTQCR